jgi:hypothetical protein
MTVSPPASTQAVEVARQEDHVDLRLPLPAPDAPPQLRALVAVGGQGGAPAVVEQGACAWSRMIGSGSLRADDPIIRSRGH